MKHDGPWLRRKNLGLADRYNYNGKEEMPFSGYLYYGFRVYDPAMARFTSIDPISHQFPYVSTFNYAENSPISNIDLHGLQKASYLYADLYVAEKLGGDVVETFNEVHQASTPFGNVPDEVSRMVVDMVLDEIPFVGEFKSIVEGDYAGAVVGIIPGGKKIKQVAEKVIGKIYKVPGKGTLSGKPYVGKTIQSSPAKRGKGAKDGRDRSQAEIIDTYDPNKKGEGPYKEQKAMDENGGVENLDNIRNERTPEKIRRKIWE